MTISCEQLDTVQQIQRLALVGAKQTGLMICHDTIAYEWDGFSSDVRARHPQTMEALHSTHAAVFYGMDEASNSERITLQEQHDALADFIEAHRKQEEAA